jgi:N-acetylmuramic acid 6-phosphate etherase
MSTTETSSKYNHLEKMSPLELLTNINKEDKTVAHSVEKCIPQINDFVIKALERMKNGGRLFYIGAGTSGRLGVVDASECPPTFGVPFELVVGLIAGGDSAIRKAVEFAEDDTKQGWIDLKNANISNNDCLVGIAASGTTPYVLGAIEKANEFGVLTGGISCNSDSPLSKLSQHEITAVVGPEFLTGSTRMKSGTAQKLILNMISTSLMIGLGKVKGNKMVDMQLSNDKLVDRAINMIMNELNINFDTAKKLIDTHGNVRNAIEAHNN